MQLYVTIVAMRLLLSPNPLNSGITLTRSLTHSLAHSHIHIHRHTWRSLRSWQWCGS